MSWQGARPLALCADCSVSGPRRWPTFRSELHLTYNGMLNQHSYLILYQQDPINGTNRVQPYMPYFNFRAVRLYSSAHTAQFRSSLSKPLAVTFSRASSLRLSRLLGKFRCPVNTKTIQSRFTSPAPQAPGRLVIRATANSDRSTWPEALSCPQGLSRPVCCVRGKAASPRGQSACLCARSVHSVVWPCLGPVRVE